MASVRNLTVHDIALPNWIVVPAKGAVTCENEDLTGAEVARFLRTLAGDGALEITFDPPPDQDVIDPVDALIPTAEVAEPETQSPPPAGKASKG